MHDDSDRTPDDTETDEAKGDTNLAEPAERSPAAAARSEAYRERFRQSQLIAAQVARARAAGAMPSEDEAARLVAEFHARGGQVTVCPEPEEPQLDRSAPGKRSSG